MHYKLLPHLWYTISSTADCDVECSNGISIHLPANFQHFLFADMESIDVSGEATVTQNPPNFTPYSESRGEEWTADLRIGHPAADAVAAVCTLTLGDLAQGGSLTDSNGQSVELEAPHAYATGWVGIADAAAAGSIKFGEHEAIEFAAQEAAKATGYIVNTGGRPEQDIGLYINGVHIIGSEGGGDVTSAWAGFINEADCGVDAEVDSENEYKINLTAQVDGEAGNDITLEVGVGVEFKPYEASGPTLTGGTDARTPQDVVDILNASEDCPAVAVLDADEQGITLTAKEYGVNDEIAITGSLFELAEGMSGGHGDYSVAELVSAISGEFTDITPAAGTAEGTITLTAGTAGKAANAVTYTAAGCFGSGSTRQGSTTRGKDAVDQTDYKIYLNGNEFTGGAPAAPVPEPLGTTTTLKHGHVYTLAVTANTDLSALEVQQYATVELWLDYTAGSITLPEWTWPDLDEPQVWAGGRRYCLVLVNDGTATLAGVNYDYILPAD